MSTSSNQTVTTENKPLPNSWRAKIRRSRGFVFMVEDFVFLIPNAATDPAIKKRIEDNCETLWKLGAADHCGNGKAEKKEIPFTETIQEEEKPVRKIKKGRYSKKACGC